jgi:serine/threonine-protein kinase
MAADLADLHARWERQTAATCRLIDGDPTPPGAAPPQRKRSPRAQPVRTGTEDPREAFELTPLWQPVRFRRGGFKPSAEGRTVRDAAAGLEWQYGGSDFPMDWAAARQAIDALNSRHWSGHSDWRLPTVSELATLLRPPPSQTDYCLPAVFAPHQKRLWSSDRRTFTSAWYVSLELGFVGWQDRTFACHVKGVRTLP